MHRDLHGGNVIYDAASSSYYMVDFDFSRIKMQDGVVIAHEQDDMKKNIFNPTHDLRQLVFDMLRYSEKSREVYCGSALSKLPRICSILLNLVTRYDTVLREDVSSWYDKRLAFW